MWGRNPTPLTSPIAGALPAGSCRRGKTHLKYVALGNETVIWIILQVLLPTDISLRRKNLKATREDNLKPRYSVGRSSQLRKGVWKEGGGEEWSGKKKIRGWLIMACVSKFQGENYENWAILARVDFCGNHEDRVPLMYTLKAPASLPGK